MQTLKPAVENDMEDNMNYSYSHIELINDSHRQGRWTDLPIIALDVDDEETASALIYAALASGDNSIMLSCLKNMHHVSGFHISTQALLNFLSLLQIETAEPDPANLVVGIAGSVVTMSVIDRYRAMVEQLLANRP